ncbi:hypothetical protein [Alkalihalobacillus trypoxylicola]|uniref:Uncharacterized protein n=1 Tax=Alkalihalobacillus trypoxylicola TaxID=519424 RepID=A0A162D5D4_9BACI|nr:hypothetical protein [Alkalihalobacillus trypoxylicola]KYG28167.1 hypothetical protein AZF04_09700 [Alkalihalobacillus trypoxylicola]
MEFNKERFNYINDRVNGVGKLMLEEMNMLKDIGIDLTHYGISREDVSCGLIDSEKYLGKLEYMLYFG